jgi:hypothetical protein
MPASRTRRILLGGLAAGTALLLGYVQLQPASAAVAPPTPSAPAIGNATYFDALGAPYGGCGLPQAELDSQNFVALNVYNTPGDYNFYPRPITGADVGKIGIWNNGLNCGRWVQVKISDFCTGVNDGAPNQAFCRNGSFTADQYNGAVLNMIVADSCGDSNGWCRDDPYHLDLAKGSLNLFERNGVAVGDMYPNHWNNRHVEWSFIPAPAYSGDITVGFLQGAQRWWSAISVSHLANGIHGVEYFQDGAWHAATMNRDMGQSYIISGLASGGTDFRIRVRDVNDALINGGREYSFALPAACSNQCGPAYTRVSYTTTGGSSTGPSTGPSGPSVGPSRSSVGPSRSSASGAPGGCTATLSVSSDWGSGYQYNVTVRNNGTAPTAGWTVSLTFAGSQTVVNSWGVVVRRNGAQLIADNADYNGVVPAGQTQTWGAVINGPNQPVTGLTCTSR